MYTVYILKLERIQTELSFKIICIKNEIKSINMFPSVYFLKCSCCGKHLCMVEFKIHRKFRCKHQVLKFITSSAC